MRHLRLMHIRADKSAPTEGWIILLICVIVGVYKRQNVSFSLYLAESRGVNYGFVGSVPMWNPEGMLIFHIEVGISEAGISLRLSYIGLAISD